MDDSAKLFEESIKAANMITDNYKKSEALSSIAQSLAQSNRMDDSAKLFEESIKVC